MTYASVRGTLTAGSTPTIVPATGTQGCVILVPMPPPDPSYGSYYHVLAYLGVNAGPTTVTLPPRTVADREILLVDLPDGVSTPLAEIAAAITEGGYRGLPQGIGQQPANFSIAPNPPTLLAGASYASPPADLLAGALGTLLLVPEGPPAGSDYGSFYSVLAYLAANGTVALPNGTLMTTIKLPPVAGIIRLDLLNGIFTPSTEIAAAITAGGSGGPPPGVGGT
jgi:hypothetical protein